MRSEDSNSSDSRLHRLAAFASANSSVDGQETKRLVPTEAGFYLLEGAPRSQLELDFVEMCYDARWVKENFDWQMWAATPEGSALLRDQRLIQKANEDQLSKIITVFIRRDRFVEGSLTQAIQDGFVQKIGRRAEELLQR